MNVQLGGNLFRLAEEPSSPETAEFRQVIDAKAQILSLGGNLLHRISAEEQI